MKRISIIGAGYVGTTIAYALDLKGIADDIVLVDINGEKSLGEANDIRHGIAAIGEPAVRAGSYADCADSDLIIVTAGRNRLPNESRLDIIQDNLDSLNEAVILKSLHTEYGGKTVVLVSHRKSTMRIADKVYSVENGRVS